MNEEPNEEERRFPHFHTTSCDSDTHTHTHTNSLTHTHNLKRPTHTHTHNVVGGGVCGSDNNKKKHCEPNASDSLTH